MINFSSFFYLILITLIIALTAFSQVLSLKSKYLDKSLFIISFLILWYIYSNRYGIGYDYQLYENMYFEINNISNLSQTLEIFTHVEIGWVLLNRLIGWIFSDVRYVFIISSGITLLCVYIFMYRWKNTVSLGLLIGIFLCLFLAPSFNAIRQFLGLSIALCSVRYIEEKNFLKFLLIILIAMQFHISAFMFIPIYFIINYLPKYKYGLIILYCSIVLLFAFYNQLISLAIAITGYSKFSIYYSSFFKINYIDMIFRFLIILFVAFHLKKIRKFDQNLFMYYIGHIYIVGNLVSMVSYIAPYIGRFSYAFEIVGILVIPYIVGRYSSVQRYVLWIIVFTIYISYFYYFFMILNWNRINPYTGIWF